MPALDPAITAGYAIAFIVLVLGIIYGVVKAKRGGGRT